MAHARFEFEMGASAEVVFDAFHYHRWRHRWDTLVRDTQVLGGGEPPVVGARTWNSGAGWSAALSMQTVFIAYDRPTLAAARKEGRSFPFKRWAASMQHRPLAADRSLLSYTYSFNAGPDWLKGVMKPLVQWIFDRQTRRRFGRLPRFVAEHRSEVQAWQATRETQP